VKRSVFLGLAMLFSTPAVGAGPTVRPDEGPVPPHYVSLDNDKVYMREGPTYDHRILWVYRRKGLPMLETAEFDVWRRVQDSSGAVGWVHSSMVSNSRTIVITSTKPAPIRAREAKNSAVLALAQPGVVAKLEACDPDACEVSAGGTEGWVDKKNVWGVSAGDVFH
jgi:SH3-like domain-containing protein